MKKKSIRSGLARIDRMRDLDWLKGHGKGYQTRIHRILRVVMESQPLYETSSSLNQ